MVAHNTCPHNLHLTIFISTWDVSGTVIQSSPAPNVPFPPQVLRFFIAMLQPCHHPLTHAPHDGVTVRMHTVRSVFLNRTRATSCIHTRRHAWCDSRVEVTSCFPWAPQHRSNQGYWGRDQGSCDHAIMRSPPRSINSFFAKNCTVSERSQWKFRLSSERGKRVSMRQGPTGSCDARHSS